MEETITPKKSYVLPFAVVLAGVIVSVAIFHISAKEKTPLTESIPTLPVWANVLKDDHVLGNPGAPIVMIEYADFQCAYCKRFDPARKALIDEYGKTGQVAFVFRHFPLDTVHPNARILANAGECAKEQGGESTFWKFVDVVMGNKKDLGASDLPEIAQSIGIDGGALSLCAKAQRHNAHIDQDFESGATAGVNGTPYSFLVQKDGRIKQLSGIYPYTSTNGKSLKSAVDELLQAK